MYKKFDGDESQYTERVLFVKEEEGAWCISRSTSSDCWVDMYGGQSKNFPASSEAGGSDSEGVSIWRYRGTRDGEWEEGMSVTCIDE